MVQPKIIPLTIQNQIILQHVKTNGFLRVVKLSGFEPTEKSFEALRPYIMMEFFSFYSRLRF